MSVVTNVVLLISIHESIEDDTEYGYRIPGLAYLNDWLLKANKGELRTVDQYGTNGKAMECHVALGAFNYLNVDEFIDAFRAAPWDEPENIQLLVQRQEDERFTSYSPVRTAGE